jgi:MFS family permease
MQPVLQAPPVPLDSVRRNLRLIRLFQGLLAAEVASPFMMLFYLIIGISQSEVFLLLAGRVGTALLLDIPSGYFADWFGRKRCLLTCATLITAVFIIEGTSTNFWPVLAAEIILGAGFSFAQGADYAFAYDTMIDGGQEEEYDKFVAAAFAYKAVGGALAALTGSLLAVGPSLRWPVLAQAPVYALLILVALCMQEPQREAVERKVGVIVDALEVVKFALHGNRQIKWFLLYSAGIVVSLDLFTWLRQSYFKEIGIPTIWFGVLMAAYVIVVALFARLAGWYERFGHKWVLSSFVGIMAATFLIMATVHSTWVLPVVMLGPAFVLGVCLTIIQVNVNRLTDSRRRATVLSVEVLLTRVCYLATGPMLGWMIGAYSLSTALLATAAIFGLLGVCALVGMFSQKCTPSV